MKIENWCGHNIRFMHHKDQWWARLDDICDAVDLNADAVAKRMDPTTITYIYEDFSDDPANVTIRRGDTDPSMIAIINELGIYEVLFISDNPEAVRLRRWTGTVLRRMRKYVGFEDYEALRMMESDVQNEIDEFLDTIFWDEDKKCLMRSVTVQGGDVDQVEFEL